MKIKRKRLYYGQICDLQDKKGELTFNLKAGNGEVILTAFESCTGMSACKGGIVSVGKNALDAKIVEPEE